MINEYLLTSYKAGARGPREYDCWGLTRAGRAALFGKPLLPSCPAARPGAIAEITQACHAVAEQFGMRPGPICPGAVATAWRGSWCVHVGLVVEADGQTWILETDVETGPCLTRPAKFEDRYTRVVYYAD